MNDPASHPATPRFAKKREAIIAAATTILNQQGVKGMTLADVAASVGLITTSVTYYFRKKEDLAAACFLSGIARYEAIIAEALQDATPQARLYRFLDLYLLAKARVRRGDEPAFPIFSDVRALTQPVQGQVGSVYNNLFRHVRRLFLEPGLDGDMAAKVSATVRTHLLMEQLFWAVVWLPRFEIEDYPRIRDRMFDILVNGVAQPDAAWSPLPLELGVALADPHAKSRETFLVAATRLINLQGYRGASVEKISAQLNVTKGSFYHHNDAKDDLVVACFDRTYEVMRRAQSLAMKLPGNQWTRLSSAAAGLVDYQLSEQGPLLRTSALSALPGAVRPAMVAQANRVSDRFSAMISDGIAEGSLRAVDPVIAAQMLNATLNAAAELDYWVKGADRTKAAALYARPLLTGVFG